MPLNLPDKLPAIELLKEENIFVIDNSRATQQDIRPLRIVILNLMPLKITTETDLVRLLSNTPLQVEISFMKIKSHTSKNTPIEHMKAFYTDFDKMRDEKYDGMIITGAPVEQMDFEEVTYWDEITGIFDWARTHVTSTLYICWAADKLKAIVWIDGEEVPVLMKQEIKEYFDATEYGNAYLLTVDMLFGWGIVEGNQITMSQASVKSYLIRGAKRNPALRYPNEEWGYGALDLYETFRRIRE